MYIDWVSRARKPDVGGDDPLEEQKGSMLEFYRKGDVWEESLCDAQQALEERETLWSSVC